MNAEMTGTIKGWPLPSGSLDPPGEKGGGGWGGEVRLNKWQRLRQKPHLRTGPRGCVVPLIADEVFNLRCRRMLEEKDKPGQKSRVLAKGRPLQ